MTSRDVHAQNPDRTPALKEVILAPNAVRKMLAILSPSLTLGLSSGSKGFENQGFEI